MQLQDNCRTCNKRDIFLIANRNSDKEIVLYLRDKAFDFVNLLKLKKIRSASVCFRGFTVLNHLAFLKILIKFVHDIFLS